ncbi:hypothetical protein [uncultured Jatrophihabitans sp.]|uniref:hypothetical protein n=1 Tax=uncultured Jatrophihabitans sp. TaxID=1610747 RepID=UPI0035CC1502
MATHVLWFAVAFISALAVVETIRLAQATLPRRPGPRISTSRGGLTAVAASVVVFVVLALAYKSHAVAHADARVVKRLVPDRTKTVQDIATVVTTVGDLVPCFVVAGVLSILIFRRSRSWTAWVLPVVVLVQISVQTATVDTFHDHTLAQFTEHVSTAGAGVSAIPSGSVSRLLSLFVLAAALWRPYSETVAARLLDLGGVVVFIELFTRLYLSRHLLGDIVAGLALSIILVAVFGWIINLDRRTPSTDDVSSADQASVPMPRASVARKRPTTARDRD